MQIACILPDFIGWAETPRVDGPQKTRPYAMKGFIDDNQCLELRLETNQQSAWLALEHEPWHIYHCLSYHILNKQQFLSGLHGTAHVKCIAIVHF